LAEVWTKLCSLLCSDTGLEAAVKANTVAGAMRIYPEAKVDMEKRGKSHQEIEAMPVSQVVLIYELRKYHRLLDGASKWHYVPFWQVGDRFRQAKQAVFSNESLNRAGSAGQAFWTLFPNLVGFGFLQEARLERGIAMLRCVEALRIYAAAHQARLPQSLDEVTEVPIPMDPLHGSVFQYHLVGDKAVLESPPLTGEEARGVRYEITVKPVTERDAAAR
jgi:hypothetical protein